MKNLIIRTITGVIFVAAIVASFLRPEAMVLLFSIVTGMTIWEFAGLVNERPGVTINRFICTVAGVYFFYAMTYFCNDLYGGAAKSVVFIPYLVAVVYLLVSELYAKQEDPINNWAYTMLSQMYIALPFSLLNVLAFTATPNGHISFNTLLPLSVFVFLWVNDTGPLVSARCWGATNSSHASHQANRGKAPSEEPSSYWLQPTSSANTSTWAYSTRCSGWDWASSWWSSAHGATW